MSTVLYEDESHKGVKFDNLVEGGEVRSHQFGIFFIKRACRSFYTCWGTRLYFKSHQNPDIGSGFNLCLPLIAIVVRGCG